MGMGVLDEAWPDQPPMSMLRHSAFGLISSGVLILNWNNFRALASGKGSGWGRDCRESPHSSGRESCAERGGTTPTRRAATEDSAVGGGGGVAPMPNGGQHRERTPTLSASDPGKI